MSDPAKSANEIEDVLASIRRLVSENHGGPVQAAPVAAEPARLVLTPAHRVTEPDDPWAPVPAAEAATSADAEDPAWGLEDRLSDWGEIEDSAEESVADAIAEQAMDLPPRPVHDPVAARGDDTLVTAVEAPAFSEFESETGDADWPQQGAPAALRQLALVRGQGQPDGNRPIRYEMSENSPTGAAEAATLPGAAPEGPGSPADLVAPAEDAASLTGGQAIEAAPEGDASDASDAADEAPRLFSRRVEVRRPATEMAATDNPAPETLAAEATAGDDDDVEDLGEDGQMFTFPETEDGTLDEETLREMIAEILREELQGALGQRITRNVRKMVRREIRLALAAQDLE